MIQFDSMEDIDYLYTNVPWAIQGPLMTLVHWRPNIVLKDLNVLNFSIWVQVWDLSLEYHTLDFAEYLGSIRGPIKWIDWSNNYPRNMRFLTMRIRIRPQNP